MKEIVTQIDIQASPRRIWDVLTDFSVYPEWNPYIIRAQGSLTPGSRLRICFRATDGQPVHLDSWIKTIEPLRELRWTGHFVAPALFRGEHIFEMFPMGKCTRLIQREKWSGLFSALVQYDGGNRYGFERMNEALKSRAEALPENSDSIAA
jgi:hypothetical protein